MNSTAEIEVRPRPLSAGLWTLFSWLRRDDRSISSESLSSAGSDRTAASFAFLAPANYETPSPFVLPAPGPPTDSYKKRVHDRNQRRQQDRDLTLHRKYGLFKSDGSYDAFSLPPVRRANSDLNNKWDRDRRAASECLQRRPVHVPGKRRAPAPPGYAVPGASASLPRRHSRKRPAPQPPRIDTNKENFINGVNSIYTQMNTDSETSRKSNHSDVTGCKYSKKDSSPKDVRVRSERSFLKHIFDSKKRNSAIDTSAIKILPSISELDKQAAEIIQAMKASEQNKVNMHTTSVPENGLGASGSWFCVKCLKKYNSSVTSCLYCLPSQKLRGIGSKENENLSPNDSSSTQTEKVSSSHKTPDEKQKLKQMLKEMKDSLPKKPKQDSNGGAQIKHNKIESIATKDNLSSETPTLRVGSSLENKNKSHIAQPAISRDMKMLANEIVVSTQKQIPIATQNAVVTHHVVVSHAPDIRIGKIETKVGSQTKQSVNFTPTVNINSNRMLPKVPQNDNEKLHTPLSISSLLNPVYIPKNKNIYQQTPANTKTDLAKPTIDGNDKLLQNVSSTTESSVRINVSKSSAASNATATDNQSKYLKETSTPISTKFNADMKKSIGIPCPTDPPPDKLRIVKTVIPATNNCQENIQTSPSPSTSNSKDISVDKDDKQNQHMRRRTLISQLEQSIAKGDEKAAADAAVKLAQLRLSCSVLSYSSQILANTNTFDTHAHKDMGKKEASPVLTSVTNTTINSETDRFTNKTNGGSERLKQSVIKTVPNTTNNDKTNTTHEENASFVPKTQGISQISQIKKSNMLQGTLLDQPSTSKSCPVNNQNDVISIAVLVEDREATRGPVQLRIKRNATLTDLRTEAQGSLGLASNLQRWIIGRKLCTDNTAQVAALAGSNFNAPFYLCIVESETKDQPASSSKVTIKSIQTNKSPETPTQPQDGNFYTELVQLEQQALVPNSEIFECGVCMVEYTAGNGVVLRDCVHTFCKECLSDVVRHCEEPIVSCPAMGCRGILQEREIRALVTPENYERWLARGLSAAESGTRNSFHCRTKDCKGWALCEPGVRRFPCPVCNANNCVPCQAIHEGESCQQYQARIKAATDTSQTDDGTKSLLNSLIRRGEALECPECKAIITKKWGCDWVKCSACKTEICWVTRGRRWGPGGRGDTSGGCRCGVDGKKCHQSCGYCH